MYTIIEAIYQELNNEINVKNKKLLEILKEKIEKADCTSILSTVEFIKISFSSNLLEDLELLMQLNGDEIFKIRHANSVIRTMLEQTIECIYLLKNPEQITTYLGDNIELSNDDVEIDDETNLIKSLLQFGQRRFVGGRKSVSSMALDINEKESKEDRLSLYEIYRLLSERDHNSLFESILDDIGMIEYNLKPIALEEIQVMYIMTIVDVFMIAYRIEA